MWWIRKYVRFVMMNCDFFCVMMGQVNPVKFSLFISWYIRVLEQIFIGLPQTHYISTIDVCINNNKHFRHCTRRKSCCHVPYVWTKHLHLKSELGVSYYINDDKMSTSCLVWSNYPKVHYSIKSSFVMFSTCVHENSYTWKIDLN